MKDHKEFLEKNELEKKLKEVSKELNFRT